MWVQLQLSDPSQPCPYYQLCMDIIVRLTAKKVNLTVIMFIESVLHGVWYRVVLVVWIEQSTNVFITSTFGYSYWYILPTHVPQLFRVQACSFL